MFCDEPIKRVYLGKYDGLDGADAYFDHCHDLAFHVTKGYRIVLETEHEILSLSAGGVRKEPKSALYGIAGEVLDPNDLPFEGFETLLFVGQRLKEVGKDRNIHLATFDDFTVKIIPYALGAMNKTVQKSSSGNYLPTQGCEHHLMRNCPCGGEGEILLDPARDYVVRCKRCKRATHADMQPRTAIENWNNGNLPCLLDDVMVI